MAASASDMQVLFNFVLTQSSVTHQMPYDVIEKIIGNSIDYVKKENINARISNVALNMDGKLVIAQVYVERKNGFAASKTDQFGTAPTAYNVQVRFPFGLNATLNGESTFLPSGDFHTLNPYLSSGPKVSDDVQRDTFLKDIILGAGVTQSYDATTQTVSFSCNGKVCLSFKISNTLGLGYVNVFGYEFSKLEDYIQHLKVHELYPLFYARKGEFLRCHSEYKGYTEQQSGEHETNNAADNVKRKKHYQAFLQEMAREIESTPAGAEWHERPPSDDSYVLDLTIINGITLFSNSGLPLTRLRDYQLDVLEKCRGFIKRVSKHNSESLFSTPGCAGRIGMGVGAGKTFFTFTLLQQLRKDIERRDARLRIPPPFCLAPNEAVAQVTARSINRQGVKTGTTAIAITGKQHIPNDTVVQHHIALSATAKREAEALSHYMHHELINDLHTEILNFCTAENFHPLQMLNLLYTVDSNWLVAFKDSMDPKRILLLAEGQKTLMNKTGMLGVTALKNLLEILAAVQEGVKKEKKRDGSFFEVYSRPPVTPVTPLSMTINYNQSVTIPRSYNGDYLEKARSKEFFTGNKINISEITADALEDLLMARYKGRLVGVRSALMRLASLKNKEAAVLLANSGGLGNTYTEDEVKAQIQRILPDAYEALHEMATKPLTTVQEHYTMYMYINELFSTIPDEINFNRHRPEGALIQLRRHGFNASETLLNTLKNKIQSKLNSIPKISGSEAAALAPYGITEGTNVIDASNELSGIIGLRATGASGENTQKLLLTHIPVFTPEGLASYFEELSQLEGKKTLEVHQAFGLFQTSLADNTVSREDIIARIKEVLSTVMIADEVHKEEFAFLYDTTNPIYQRINNITTDYLGQPFHNVLPHRIGMSGTLNDVAENAFKGEMLYDLSTQKMMQKGMIKQVDVHTMAPSYAESINDIAKQIVTDYFSGSTELLIDHVLDHKKRVFCDIHNVSKGLLFSKTPNDELNRLITEYFNLLLKSRESMSPLEMREQEVLLTQINQTRMANHRIVKRKLDGQEPLTPTEVKKILAFNSRSDKKIDLTDNKITNGISRTFTCIAINPEELRKMQGNAFEDHMFALYLEFILSKSNTPKELSDIVGLQNTLYGIESPEYHRLTSLAQLKGIPLGATVLSSIQSVEPATLSIEDITAFVSERIHDAAQRDQLIDIISRNKTNYEATVRDVQAWRRGLSFDALITANRGSFELGTTLAMLGGPAERTGYSHEPVGIVMDIPAQIDHMQQLNHLLRGFPSLDNAEMLRFFNGLNHLIDDTLSYDEKNQAGGRSLRTPYGQTKYVEYQSQLQAFLAARIKEDEPSPLRLLQIETSFTDIFTPDEAYAEEMRSSISFNRALLRMVQEENRENVTFIQFERAVRMRFKKELRCDKTKEKYQHYINERLPLAWAMKYLPEIVPVCISSDLSKNRTEVTPHPVDNAFDDDTDAGAILIPVEPSQPAMHSVIPTESKPTTTPAQREEQPTTVAEMTPESPSQHATEEKIIFSAAIDTHIKQFEMIIEINNNELSSEIRKYCRDFQNKIREISQKNIALPERISELKQETKKVKKQCENDRKAWSVLREFFTNFLALLSGFGLIYLGVTQTNRSSFWYETQENRPTYRLKDALSQLEKETHSSKPKK